MREERRKRSVWFNTSRKYDIKEIEKRDKTWERDITLWMMRG